MFMRKCVLITGASGAIGSEIALEFARKGHNVAVHYNTNKKSAEALCQKICALGVKCVAVRADVSKRVQVLSMFETIEKDLGGVDILINNAGVSSIKMLCDVDEAEWDKTIDVNLKSAYLCTNAATPHMVNKKWGRIVNISSVWGIKGASCEVHYSASKSALVGFSKALAKELALSGITVNCVCPGFIDTPMNSALSDTERREVFEEIPLGKPGKPIDVAKAVCFLCSDDASYITAQVLGVDGGWNA